MAGLFGGLKGTVHIEPGTDLTLPSTAPIYLYESADADLVQGEPELPAAAWPSLSPAAPSTTHQEYSPKSEPGGPEED
ncbi:hypothetical protein ACFSKM_13860 [Ancylobacter dichloromethanicus]